MGPRRARSLLTGIVLLAGTLSAEAQPQGPAARAPAARAPAAQLGPRVALAPPIYPQPAPAPATPAPAAAAAPKQPPLVVIDPGHGGSNLGAPGLRGLPEKQLTLPLARNLAARLEARGARVLLTRDRDRFLTLRERLRVANQNSAAAFVSVHANASPTHTQQGFETWILSADAVDIDARALRTGDGAPRPGLDRATALLLDDLERGAAQWEAAELAATIQDQLARVRGPAASRGVRQESKHVLLGATMPAVLVEVGFIDHAVEGRELLDPAVQDAIADALANALAIQLGLPDVTPRR
jgi:N-acetylmuramoyl-L-alanine amidase